MEVPPFERFKVFEEQEEEGVDVLGRLVRVADLDPVIGVGEAYADGLLQEENRGVVVPTINKSIEKCSGSE